MRVSKSEEESVRKSGFKRELEWKFVRKNESENECGTHVGNCGRI